MRELVFLGTGTGMPRRSNCTAILIREGEQNLLIDAGGGHDIIRSLHASEIEPGSIQRVFVSHYDSDHILGVVPLVRVFNRGGGKHEIICSEDVKKGIDSMFQYVAHDHFEEAGNRLKVSVVGDRTQIAINTWELTFFDVRSPDGSPQLGLVLTFPDSVRLAFLGDEPMRDHYLDLIGGVDVLVHDAFCLSRDENRFKPHPKNHSTVAEAAANAKRAGAKTLVLYHMEDETLESRKREYAKEASRFFDGPVFVPVDLDRFEF
jgi:ribonuclease Z